MAGAEDELPTRSAGDVAHGAPAAVRSVVPVDAGPDEFDAAVLDLVDRIPPGRAMTYGGIAAALGRGGPRGVGAVMARYGSAVPWWRVVRANGALVSHLMVEAQVHWLEERTPVRRGVVDLERAVWWPPD